MEQLRLIRTIMTQTKTLEFTIKILRLLAQFFVTNITKEELKEQYDLLLEGWYGNED